MEEEANHSSRFKVCLPHFHLNIHFDKFGIYLLDDGVIADQKMNFV